MAHRGQAHRGPKPVDDARQQTGLDAVRHAARRR
jgi:hypothetical protein